MNRCQRIVHEHGYALICDKPVAVVIVDRNRRYPICSDCAERAEVKRHVARLGLEKVPA